MKVFLSPFSVFAIMLGLAVAVPLYPQEKPNQSQDNGFARGTVRAPEPFKGFSEYEEFRGAATSSEAIFKLDSSLAYDFNRYAGVFVGMPLYFVHDSALSAGGNLSGSAAGDVYFGLNLYAPTSIVKYSTTFTVSAPTGSESKGFSTGHRTLDWTNRFRRRFDRVTPFLAAGISNTVPDTDLITRTFTPLGNVVHLEEGAEYDVTRRVYLGASGYQIFPFGNQEVVDRLSATARAEQSPGDGDVQGPPSAVSHDQTRENGFDLWLGFEPTRVLRLEAGYSRSLSFALNRLSLNVGLNVGRLFKERTRHE